MEKLNIVITTDGACSGNPGPGGYAAIIRCLGHSKTLSGFNPQTTNNRMELSALIESIKYLKRPGELLIRTDSTYVIDGIVSLEERKKNDWKTKTGASIANLDLWKELDKVNEAGKHHFQMLKVDGHTGDPDNERCDQLAKQKIKEGV